MYAWHVPPDADLCRQSLHLLCTFHINVIYKQRIPYVLVTYMTKPKYVTLWEWERAWLFLSLHVNKVSTADRSSGVAAGRSGSLLLSQENMWICSSCSPELSLSGALRITQVYQCRMRSHLSTPAESACKHPDRYDDLSRRRAWLHRYVTFVCV